MYDDRDYSRPRSPGRRSPRASNTFRRSPPRGPAADRRRDSRDRSRTRYRSPDRDDYRRRSSRSPPPRRGRPVYRDRDREDYRSPEYDSRSRSYSRGRSRSHRQGRHAYGQESREVMMDGLPVDMAEEDSCAPLPTVLDSKRLRCDVAGRVPGTAEQISIELKDHYHVEGLEDIRVIRDRQTKVSRRLGFLRFQNVSDSRAFIERNFPSVVFYGPNPVDDRGTKVRIAFSRERDDRNRNRAEGDWTCPMCSIVNYSTRQRCFRCQAPRPDARPAGPPGMAAPAVENHGDNDAAPDHEPSQFLLFRGLEPSVTEELLAKGVSKLYRPASNGSENVPGSQKKGAKVASTTGDANLGARDGSIRRVLLVRDRKSNDSWRYGFAEFAAVQDAQAAITRLKSFEKFTISSRPVMVSYIHAGVFVPVVNPRPETARFTFSPLNNASVKLMYWDDEAYVTDLPVSTDELEGEEQAQNDQAQESQGKGGRDAEKAKKRKADPAASTGSKKAAMPSHLQFWSNRHAELHGVQKKAGDENSTGLDRGDSPGEAHAPPAQSFADLSRNCCYLCMRQFGSSAEVNQHERLSQLHRGNLQNDELKERAMAKLVKHGIAQQPATEYRDRARERRKAFGKAKTTGKPAPAPPKEEDEPSVQAPSKGASLLSKMGWSGTGLGAQESGMTAPISTEVYAQGVGLGAQGSRLGEASEEAGRNTRGRYEEFVEKTRQTARDRYDQTER